MKFPEIEKKKKENSHSIQKLNELKIWKTSEKKFSHVWFFAKEAKTIFYCFWFHFNRIPVNVLNCEFSNHEHRSQKYSEQGGL